MKTERAATLTWAPLVVAALAGCVASAPDTVVERSAVEIVELPTPSTDGDVSLEEALVERRSERVFSAASLAPATVGQLLWAAQGESGADGYRTAPSAGARYPLELYAVTATDVLHYLPDGHRVERRRDPTALGQLGDAAFGQQFVTSAPVVFVVAGVPARTEVEYGGLAVGLVEREAGHATQNLLLQATALGLSAVPVGGLDPGAVSGILALPPGYEVFYLVPVGQPV